MFDAKMMNLPQPRSPVQSRSIATRNRLLDAGICCLSSLGYAGTSIQVVMNATGVSRGSILHQFPTRLDMMVAIAESAMQRIFESTNAELERIVDPKERIVHFVDISWEMLHLPASSALNEILLASRYDSRLRDRLVPLTQWSEKTIGQLVTRVFHDAGLVADENVQFRMRTLLATIRGLTMESISENDTMTKEMVEYLRDQLNSFIESVSLTC